MIVIDDLLATGGSNQSLTLLCMMWSLTFICLMLGTLEAATKLLDMAGANVVECIVLIELNDLNGRKKIGGTKVHSFIQYWV